MLKRNPLPSVDYLRECFDLELETGRAFWRVRPARHFRASAFRSAQRSANIWNSIWAGQETLCCNDRGYRWGNLDDQKLYAHRVIWKIVHEEEPDTIDHINGDESDNRPINLRNVSHKENCHNQRMNSRNRSGVAGVYWESRLGRWRVLRPGGGSHHLGYFANFQAAAGARKAAEREAGYHPNHGRKR